VLSLSCSGIISGFSDTPTANSTVQGSPGRGRRGVGDDKWGPPISGCDGGRKRAGCSWAESLLGCVGCEAKERGQRLEGALADLARELRMRSWARPSGWRAAAREEKKGRLQTFEVLGSSKNIPE
jgi:hypothetical protein